MTTPRATKDGRAALPSVMDMFVELAMTSQYKISLHLGDSGGNQADKNVTDWLTSCGVLGNFNANVPNENLKSLRYEFMCDVMQHYLDMNLVALPLWVIDKDCKNNSSIQEHIHL